MDANGNKLSARKIADQYLKKTKKESREKKIVLKKNNIQVRLRIAISRLASLSLPSLAFCICLNIFGQYWGRNDDDSAGWMTTHWTGRDDKWRRIKQKATFISNKKYPCNTSSQGKVHLYALFRRKYLCKKKFFFYPKGLEVFCVDFLIKDASTDMYMKTFNAYVLTSTSTSTFCFIHSLSLLKYVLVIPNIDIL